MDVSEQDVLIMAENLAGGIQIPTISYEEGSFEADALNDINEYIEETYPNLRAGSEWNELPMFLRLSYVT